MSESPLTPSILLVDDQPANLVALEAVLDSLRVRLVRARSGAEALAQLEREPFAVILLDVQMAGMDGFETAARLRSLPNGREVPILFLTAIHRDERYARRGYAVGAADYITKPFDPDVLRARVRSYIDLFRQREEAYRVRLESRARQLEGAHRRLEAFERIASAALENDGVDPFLHSIAAVFIGAADAADTVGLLLRRGERLYARASIGAAEDVADGFSVPIGDGFCGRVAADGKPLFVSGEAVAALVESPAMRARGLRAIYGAPLVGDQEIIGVAYIGSTRADSFSPAEMKLFEAMAQRASWAVAREIARGRVYAVLRAVPVAVGVFRSPDFVCEFANEACRAMYGGRDVAGCKAQDLGFGNLVASFEAVVSHGEPVIVDDLPLAPAAPDADPPSERFFRCSMHPLRDPLGRPESVLFVGVDLTDQVRTRRALEGARKDAELANRTKDEFLATVAHELRNPVSGILGWVAAGRAGANDARRALDAIERSARAQGRLLDDMLDVARIASGQLRLELASTDASQVLLDALESIRPAAEAKGIGLDVRFGQSLGYLALDGGRVQQVVSNLLSNAVKFTPRGGSVRLTAGRSAAALLIEVSDTGEGIPAEFLPHVFEPFRQADSSVARTHRGVGLGLAIAQKLVAAHGGTIRVASDGRGRGATFSVELPVRVVPAIAERAVAAEEGRRLLPSLDGMRVLVVDDETDALEAVTRVLESRGARVQRSVTAREALLAMGAFRPDVIVSDLAMPQTDGYALIRNIRTLPPELGGATPAIALTARVRVDERQRAFTAGFQEHIAKPVEAEELVATVAGVAARSAGAQKPPPRR